MTMNPLYMNNLFHHTYMRINQNSFTIIILNPSIPHRRHKKLMKLTLQDQPNENEKTKCLNTNHIYQNIQKEQPKEKIWTIPFLLESPRSKEFQPPDLEIDFFN